eukprot:Clim_evm53s25 gene=Clim_evmTU53s25
MPSVSNYVEDLHNADEVRTATNEIITLKAVHEALEQVGKNVATIEKQLHSEIAEHYRDLLEQALGLKNLDTVLTYVSSRVISLQNSILRLQSGIGDYHERIATTVKQLRRTQETCVVMRNVLRFLQILKRLDATRGSDLRDKTKTAQSLADIQVILDSGDLDGIDVVDKEREGISAMRRNLIKETTERLKKSYDVMDSIELATVCFILQQLGELGPAVNRLLKRQVMEMQHRLKQYLDPETIKTSVEGPEKTLLNNIEEAFGTMYQMVKSCAVLQRVLLRKNDPRTHRPLADSICSRPEDMPLQVFWTDICKALQGELNRAASMSKSLRQALSARYPSYLKLVLRLWNRIESLSRKEDLQISEESLRGAGIRFEEEYLTRSLDYMFDIVGEISRTSSREMVVQKLLNTIKSDIVASEFDGRFCTRIGRNVGKILQRLVVECEQSMYMEPDAVGLRGPCPPKQLQNINIVNVLGYVRDDLGAYQSMDSHLPDSYYEHVNHGLDICRTMIEDYFDLFFTAVQGKLTGLLADIHVLSEDYGDESSFTDDLQSQILNLHTEFLARFRDKLALTDRVRTLMVAVLEHFVWHASVVHPLEDRQRGAILQYAAQIEAAFGPLLSYSNCSSVMDLGESEEKLRAFKSLISLPVEAILGSKESEVLGSRVTAHAIICRAPASVAMPWELKGIDVATYAVTFPNYAELEFRSNLENFKSAYVNDVNARGMTEFDVFFPLLNRYLDKE